MSRPPEATPATRRQIPPRPLTISGSHRTSRSSAGLRHRSLRCVKARAADVCGIAGKLDFAQPVDREAVPRMCRAMEHRGPDSRGLREAEGAVIGAQRLAIIDVA